MELWSRLALVGTILALGLVPVAGAQSAPILTTSLMAIPPIETHFQGQQAVNINYTNTSSSSFSPAFVYLSVQNTLGQTVGVFYATANINAGNVAPVYLVIFGVPTGHYTGVIFATTPTGIPISGVSTIAMTL